MGFDSGKFQNSVQLGKLARLGCSREVLKNGAARYAIASALPGEYRKALLGADVTVKQLQTHVKAAHRLARLLSQLQHSPRITLASSVRQDTILSWRKALGDVAQYLKTLPVFRPDAKEAALAVALHVDQQTGERHLPEICKLLNAALTAAGLPDSLTVGTLEKQITRAHRQRAERLLQDWESFSPPKKLQE
jgi:hypothetical protein